MKRLFAQKLDVLMHEKQAREERTEGRTLRRAGSGKGTEEGRAFWDQQALFGGSGIFHWGRSVPTASW